MKKEKVGKKEDDPFFIITVCLYYLCCYITVDFATTGSQNGFKLTRFPVTRKPI
jgi:hypothetical protein